MADGRLRRSTRALREIQQDGAGHPTLETSVFGLRGEALANRVRAAAKAAGLSDKFLGHSARIGMAREMVGGGGRPTPMCSATAGFVCLRGLGLW